MTKREDYKYFTSISTRWKDNDVYGHVNNVEYYSYFDTVINSYLIRSGVLDFRKGALVGVCAESHCEFAMELSFPELVDAGLRVDHVGRTSARYGVGLFRAEHQTPAAEGWFVHVFVDRATRRPSPLTAELRSALEALMGVEG